MMEDVTAAECAASVADWGEIQRVEKEVQELEQNAPSLRSNEAITKFWCEFWKEIAKRYA